MRKPDRPTYRGRFAPSPTGPLHFGSLVAALASYADARANGGTWLIRMEDLDRPRVAPGAADEILRTLDALGFEWDGPVLLQSTRTDAYDDALERLSADGLTYPCSCSRRQIARDGRPGPEGPVYPGTCRTANRSAPPHRAIRVLSESAPVAVDDRIQGRLIQDLARDVGDFVLRRADGIHTYQLAVVVDDALQCVNQVMRGADLMLSSPRQIHLHRLLGLIPPAYAHVPIALDAAGRKLSKSDGAAPVDPKAPLPALIRAWSFLGQAPWPEPPCSLEELWEVALTSWDPGRVPRQGSASLPPAVRVPKPRADSRRGYRRSRSSAPGSRR